MVLQLAQQKLRNVFGMELVELMTRNERDEQQVNGTKKKGLCNKLPNLIHKLTITYRSFLCWIKDLYSQFYPTSRAN